ncbi:N-acetylmuramoyl-L-alanine amidase [Xylella fastidiosa]|uniref:N-acetylmuramoyl-L-alanine amidase n=1 Tax=Xylella fastidiosa TaxID=2371 RepID=UPI000765ABD4|nr:N-acetylmuramoyl-L-alanine amidase [Xylella fastidiosa]ALR02701.1 N-acetylmuramoyl-L-alanine amidase [Xylella fastidiosa]KXB16074.1 N-acetylmuramoyl-L-alanine amidase [Xylella fastidiosa]KXB22854.1 N-acetylmuramoyl-L-alanine amidase [Xylella fastidiosa]MDG5822688.1 N-acetylmuramoyl-L-alanine amidase [Xylella fastidiosa subsp. pauca]MDG5826189.1 N-acetylmuramoyl-L-alanine amidase [Xylella fastidiosa subsp. pauca]
MLESFPMIPVSLRFRYVALLLVASLAVLAPRLHAGEVNAVELTSSANGTRAEIRLSGRGAFKTISLSAPERLVVDFPASSAIESLKLPTGRGVVRSVRTGQPVSGTFRVVFDLANPVAPLKPQMQVIGNVSTLVIEWPGGVSHTSTAAAVPSGSRLGAEPDPVPAIDSRAEAARATAMLTGKGQHPSAMPVALGLGELTTHGVSPADILNGASVDDARSRPASAAVAAPASTFASSAAEGAVNTLPSGTVSPLADVEGTPAEDTALVPTAPVVPGNLSRMQMASGMRSLVVAIDPGHGGQDSGAVGPTGKLEKNVTLAIGRELARQINATPGMKAYMTRDSDVFIPLPMRAQRARAAKADIFISIHADAADNRAATGSSVYVLSTRGASSQRARWLADKENAADLVGGVRLQKAEPTLANVLLDLAQSGYMKASEDAADHVLGSLKRVANNHKSEVEHANFAVLRTSDMPAMLVETAFISNAYEERRLVDPAFQRQLAAAVLEGVITFFTNQPPPGTLFALRAQAEPATTGGSVITSTH